MNGITDEQITDYVSAHIGTFHDKRLEALEKLKISDLLAKNPYLFKSKNLVIVGDLVRYSLDAYLSSQEETLFGDFLEGLAIYVAGRVRGGYKSGITGIDLEFVKDGARYIVSIKSGPNWGNSSQIAKMKSDFSAAARVIRQGNAATNVISVNGCCYGRDTNPDKDGYFKYCGQKFWELISGDRELYTRIIEPLGHNAQQRNDDFTQRYGPVINRFTRIFTHNFCDDTGAIDWEKLVRYSSAVMTSLLLPADKRAVNQLSDVASVCYVLGQWGYAGLAERIESLVGDDPHLDLGSLRGLLMMLGRTESGTNIRLTATPEGLTVAEWQFADNRHAKITFQDVDRATVDATNASGNRIPIRKGKNGFNRRDTIVNKLIEHCLFSRR